jgi:hypothetical protein
MIMQEAPPGYCVMIVEKTVMTMQILGCLNMHVAARPSGVKTEERDRHAHIFVTPAAQLVLGRPNRLRMERMEPQEIL